MAISSLSASDFRITAIALPEYDAKFQRTDGWIGADGDYSAVLDDNTVAWFFSDTFVGSVRDNRRVNATLINNSVAIQHLNSSKPIEFFYGADADGQPAAFVTPDDGRGYFWLFAGVPTSKGLHIFLTRVQRSEENQAFPFKVFGMALGHITNPSDPPSKWRVTQQQVPFCRFTDSGSLLLGSAALKVGSYVYIYGSDSLRNDKDGKRVNSMIVARVPEDRLGDLSKWRFLSGGKWITNATRCDALFYAPPTEFSVSYVPGIQKYAVVYMHRGIFGKIMVRLAPSPEGPWGEEIEVFECPDKDWHEKAYSYAAKAHPELSTDPNELIVTYATNSMEFFDLFEDARLYWPRFVKLKFESPQQLDRGIPKRAADD